MNHLPLNVQSGESATSILVADAAVSVDPAVKHLAHLSFRRGGGFLYSLPCRLGAWQQVLGDLYGSAEHILTEHSCFPAFAAGMSADCAARGVVQLQFLTRSRTVFPRLAALLECGNRYGLRCPACAAQAVAATGRAPSLVWYCLPFVSRCVHDGELLRLADEASTYEAGMFALCCAAARHNSELYAACAYTLVRQQTASDLRADCLLTLSDCGYQRAGGRWNIAQLTHDWYLVARDGFEDCRLSTVAVSDGFPSCLLRAALRVERPMHPAWLALLNWFVARQGESRCIVSAKPPRPAAHSRRTGAAYRPSPADIKAHRQQWLTHKAAHPAAGRKALKRGLYAVWAWLYRNDRAWLLDHQPPIAARRGGRRGAKQSVLLGSCVRVPAVPHQDRRGLPHLGTAYQVRIRLGVTDYAYGRLLGLDAGLARRPTNRDELALTRVACAQLSCELDQRTTPLSVLARRVSLRETTLMRALRKSAGEEKA